MISLSNVSKIFSTDEMDTFALRDINLVINEGEFVAICGPSGGGKSTLLSILGTHDSPTTGQYFFDDIEVTKLSAHQLLSVRRERIGFIFQEFNLIDDVTVAGNIALPLIAKGLPKKKVLARVHEMLSHFGIAHRSNHYPGQLSGGQQQRVAIARAFASSPMIILADEPTGNLDSANGQVVMDMLVDAHKNGATICMVTHDPRCAAVATRILTICDGQLQE
jgi:putative ABC transport system ATP-binding protein